MRNRITRMATVAAPVAHPGRRRAVALLMTLLVIVLLVAIVAQLTTATATQAVIEGRRQRTLQHELAVDSLLVVIPAWFAEDRGDSITGELDRLGVAIRELEVGTMHVRVTVTDDAAKLNPNVWGRDDQRSVLERKLRLLSSRYGLPAGAMELSPVPSDKTQRYRWFGQLLCDESRIFSGDGDETVWSDVLTLWGDGRMALRRVQEPALEALLDDLRPGLARDLLKKRPAERTKDFVEEALEGVDSSIRDQVRQRVLFDAGRYALRVDTSMGGGGGEGGDRRRWYVVCQVDQQHVAVLHRSARTW